MSRLRNIYLYLVSFVSLMMILGGIIFTVQNISDVILPTGYYYEPIVPEKTGTITTEDQYIYDENKKKFEENRNIESKKNVIKSIAVVIVALPSFAYHWRKIERERKELK